MLPSFLAAAAILAPQPSQAKVTRFVVEERAPIKGGEFGDVGRYERLKGTAYFEVDPKDRRNKIIFNLDKAPKNAAGMVEFSSPFLILKPVNMKKGNGKLWYGINNRGTCIEVAARNTQLTATCNPETVDDLGLDNPLMTGGFATVDAGWHGDGVMPPDRSLLFPSFPIARRANGKSIVGPHRVELQPQAASFSQSLVVGFKPYPTADANTRNAKLTVRDRADAPRRQIPADRWAFGTCPEGRASLTPTETDLCLFDGFKPLSIYELYYDAKDPIVMGLAYAVTRDIGSFLRNQKQDDEGNPNPLREGNVDIRRAYVSGTSSTGMYSREFLYLGFNEDENGRKVFDAATIYSAASHRLFANVQFASPTYYSGQDQHHDYTSNSIPPFTFAVTKDPVSGWRDGILKRPETDPLVLQIDEELVFWRWKASLNVVDSAGRPVAQHPNVRLYFQNGFGHISAAGLLSTPTPSATCQHLGQGFGGIGWTPRALVPVIDDWADRGVEPPPSNYPTLENGELVTLEQYRNLFPKIPGVSPPAKMNRFNVLYFGPYFDSTGGAQTILPPSEGPRYKALVPKPRDNGDGAGGIDTMFTRAPTGTNVGWNVYTAPRDPDLCSLSGSYKAFAKTADERQQSGDSRPSLEERYGDHDGFVRAVRRAARQLVKERFLLESDAEKFIKAARESDVLNEQAAKR